MKFLFTGAGYPGARGADAGSGIGTYLREITQGLSAQGHQCHVLIWGGPDAPPSPQDSGGVLVFTLPRRRWPLVERRWTDLRAVQERRQAACALDREHRYDWIEIQSDEGIDIGIQRALPGKTVLRAHTTLLQMVDYKRTPRTPQVEAWLARERESLLLAPRILTHAPAHAQELLRLFPGLCPPAVVPHGLDLSFSSSSVPPGGAPQFLVVGTPDRRKGLDRLPAVLQAYAQTYGPCRCVLVSQASPAQRRSFGLHESLPGAEIVWRERLSDAELSGEYGRSSALLHLARYESFGYPLIEAAAAGVPVVATPTGIAPQVLGGGLARFLVDGDAPSACAAALAEAVQGRAAVGAALRELYQARYTRAAMTQAFLGALAAWA